MTNLGETIAARERTVNRVISSLSESPHIALLMSGKGSNADNILMKRRFYPNLDFRAIITDNPASQAHLLSRKHGLTYIEQNIDVTNAHGRTSSFEILAHKLDELTIDCLIYAGFMKVAPSEFVFQFPGINIHPSDLTRVDAKGTPLYTGLWALRNALRAGEAYVASTVYVVDDTIDAGFPLAISKHISTSDFKTSQFLDLHAKLKREGEHHLFPRVLARMSQGRINKELLPFRAESDELERSLGW